MPGPSLSSARGALRMPHLVSSLHLREGRAPWSRPRFGPPRCSLTCQRPSSPAPGSSSRPERRRHPRGSSQVVWGRHSPAWSGSPDGRDQSGSWSGALFSLREPSRGSQRPAVTSGSGILSSSPRRPTAAVPISQGRKPSPGRWTMSLHTCCWRGSRGVCPPSPATQASVAACCREGWLLWPLGLGCHLGEPGREPLSSSSPRPGVRRGPCVLHGGQSGRPRLTPVLCLFQRAAS